MPESHMVPTKWPLLISLSLQKARTYDNPHQHDGLKYENAYTVSVNLRLL